MYLSISIHVMFLEDVARVTRTIAIDIRVILDLVRSSTDREIEQCHCHH